MRIDNRGGRESAATDAVSKEEAFGRHRRRLEEAIDESCSPEQPWPARVATAIHSALGFADLDPAAARMLTAHAAVRRFEGRAAFVAMVEHLAAMLSRDAPQTRRAGGTARNVVLRIARQVNHRIECEPDAQVADTAPDLIVFALTPYVGFSEAKRWASSTP